MISLKKKTILFFISFVRTKLVYSWPLSDTAVRGSNPPSSQNPRLTYSWPSIPDVAPYLRFLHICGLLYPWFHIRRINQRWSWSTAVFTTEKNPCVGGPMLFKLCCSRINCICIYRLEPCLSYGNCSLHLLVLNEMLNPY